MATSRPKRLLIEVHKWLGIVLAPFFLMWFLSGLVLHFVAFPELTPDERLRALPVLDAPSGCCLGPDAAAARAGLAFDEARFGLRGDEPVWRLRGRAPGTGDAARWHVVDARTGALRPGLSTAAAAQLAETFSGRRALRAERLERDQWTVPQALDPYRPLARVDLDGADGLVLYVSLDAAEVVRDTRRAERFWNWIGAVPHWIYPTVLRRFPQAWHQVVVALALPGVVLAASGLMLGLWQLFLNRSRWIPYRQPWLRWHHILGLVAGAFTLTWILSGLLSMNPWDVFTPRGAAAPELARWRGPPAAATSDPAAILARARARGLRPRELELVRIDGQAWYRLDDELDQWLVRADGAGGAADADAEPLAMLPDATMTAALRRLRPDAGSPALARLDAYDTLYYAAAPADTAGARHRRPLPVWRADWADGTTLYADPRAGRILLRAEASGRWQRHLYHGLHTFDYAALTTRPWLRHALIVGMSLLGMGLCATSCVIAWRVLRPGRPRRRNTPAC